ncbi:poly-beta-hydroxybutyrate-responsive repressor [Calidifontibacillus erzurumensis]|uniref:Poly-beta-hydroxybutyrate-responsive repressor n=1 Tax=Calidifontibacillus erzurumensis TaxID=2741433 RepID=A0A8J8GCI8_9BACI|nr:poly-beta-hydroxybutyrate-responsive repressor [Calidifontibacillus erzurumensis]NSL50892.1 poly-beta-hydroxybutyrate-responsive repressor [Calidifontibacillus erzurumensis]
MTNRSSSSSNKSEQTFQAPKNLIVPFILLSLRNFNCHGYKILQQLIDFGFSTIDQGNLYRILRQLEKEEMVKSEWDTSEAGPAKRIYSLTEAGENYLKTCVYSLEQYQLMLNQFFSIYTKMFTLPNSKEEKKSKE